MTDAQHLMILAYELDELRDFYPEAEKLMAGLIVESLHEQAEALDPSLYYTASVIGLINRNDGGLSNKDKSNCAGFPGADTKSGGD